MATWGGAKTPQSTLDQMGTLPINQQAEQPALSTAAPSQSYDPQEQWADPMADYEKWMQENGGGGVPDGQVAYTDPGRDIINAAHAAAPPPPPSYGIIGKDGQTAISDADWLKYFDGKESEGYVYYNGSAYLYDPQSGMFQWMYDDPNLPDDVTGTDPVGVQPLDPNAESGAQLYGVDTLFGRAGMRRIWGPGKTDIIRPPTRTPLADATDPEPVETADPTDPTGTTTTTTTTTNNDPPGPVVYDPYGYDPNNPRNEPEPEPEPTVPQYERGQRVPQNGFFWGYDENGNPIFMSQGEFTYASRVESGVAWNRGDIDPRNNDMVFFGYQPDGSEVWMTRQEYSDTINAQPLPKPGPESTETGKEPPPVEEGKDPEAPPSDFDGSLEVWQMANNELAKDLYKLPDLFDMSGGGPSVAQQMIDAQSGIIAWIDTYNWPPEIRTALIDRAYDQFTAWTQEFAEKYNAPFYTFLVDGVPGIGGGFRP